MKKLHLYWGTENPLSWLRYMTVITFLRHNPDWEVFVWYSDDKAARNPWPSREQQIEYKGPCYFGKLLRNKKVTVKKVVGIPRMAHVHASDLIRWRVLSKHGGFWSDFDILYYKPMSELPEKDVFLISYESRGEEIWPVGFMGASKEGKAFYKPIYQEALVAAERGLVHYQQIGRELLEKHVQGMEGQDRCYVYPYMFNKYARQYFENGHELQFLPHTIGVHWYGGHASVKTHEMRLNEETVKSDLYKDTVAGKILRNSFK